MREKGGTRSKGAVERKKYLTVVRVAMVLYTWKRDCELLIKEKVLQSFNHNDLLHLMYGLHAYNRATHTVGYYLF